ncbi:MAG TPA: OsmC family protein [Nocardioidaceae bacterium]|nr:OsmC family protein [Nocardioidaceae bacterium]
MIEENMRTVDITRTSRGVYEAVNRHGVKMVFSHDGAETFTPVELLLTAIAGCSGIDVDFITSKRSEPVSFTMHIEGEKVRDETGKNAVSGISLTFDIAFPEGEGGDAARGVLERAVHQSHDRLCSVSRTVEIGTPVEVRIADQDGRQSA